MYASVFFFAKWVPEPKELHCFKYFVKASWVSQSPILICKQKHPSLSFHTPFTYTNATHMVLKFTRSPWGATAEALEQTGTHSSPWVSSCQQERPGAHIKCMYVIVSALEERLLIGCQPNTHCCKRWGWVFSQVWGMLIYFHRRVPQGWNATRLSFTWVT